MIVRAKKLMSYFHPIVLEEGRGEFMPYLEVIAQDGKLVLNGRNVNYSFGSLHKVFDKTFEYFNLHSKRIDNALILGFGAGSVARIISDKYNANCRITGVEKDGMVLRHAHKYFDIGRFSHLNLIYADALEFIRNTNETYDLIVIDLFVENRVPPAAKQVEFLIAIRDHLNDDGMVFFNKITYTDETKREADKLSLRMQEVFGKILRHTLIEQGIETSMLVYQTSFTPIRRSQAEA